MGSAKAESERNSSEALRARFTLLMLAAVLRNGTEISQVDRDFLAERLEVVAKGGADANAVFIHANGRARQRSATELQKVLTAVVAHAERAQDSSAKRAEGAVGDHIGAGSVETVRAARRKYGQGVKQIASSNSSAGQAALESIARVLTANVKRPTRKS